MHAKKHRTRHPKSCQRGSEVPQSNAQSTRETPERWKSIRRSKNNKRGGAKVHVIEKSDNHSERTKDNKCKIQKHIAQNKRKFTGKKDISGKEIKTNGTNRGESRV